jgi:hypothetical protein
MKEIKTSLAVDKDFRLFISNERNKYLTDNNIAHMGIEDYLKRRLGYVRERNSEATLPSGSPEQPQ